jgi:hypothetical protein
MSRRSGLFAAAFLLILLPSQGALAGNYKESVAWQFQTTDDKVNLAIIEDLRQKKKNGFYAPPIYNTTNVTHIDKQFNCGVTSSAIGNNGTNSTIANTASASGNTGKAIGNNNDTNVLGKPPGGASVTGSQDNSGTITANVSGNSEVEVEDSKAWQVLNSDQNNTGNQSASVSGSTGCAFGALN